MAFHFLPKGRKTYHIGFHDPVTGKFRHISAETKIEAEAKKKAKQHTAKLNLGLGSELVKASLTRLTLKEGFQHFITHKHFAAKTIELYKIAFSHLIAAVGDKEIHRITSQDYTQLSRYFYSHDVSNPHSTGANPIPKHKLSQNSISTYLRQLNTLFNFFQLNGFIEKNIIQKVKPQQKEVRTIPAALLDQLFNDLQKTNINHFNIIKLKYLAALRISEVVNIKVGSIDLVNKQILVQNQKAKRPDIIPIPSDLELHLQTIVIPSAGLIFPQYSIDAIKSAWRRSFKRIGSPFYNIHLLRKTRGTILAENGVNPFFLQKFMRHTSIKTTEQYYLNVNINKARLDINSKLEK
ncbi:MAG: tyrosine-type recombinase/integrase [Ignavibacteriales bacterium]|nr:tyrosine-type recombinase/integrase [Ignavibacteriales bacterium]